MEKNRRKFTEDFKQQSLRLVEELGSVRKAAQELGVDEANLYRWKREFKKVQLVSGGVKSVAELDILDLDQQIREGQFGPLREWLGEKIYLRGSLRPAQELLHQITGRHFDPAFHLEYLTKKYT